MITTKNDLPLKTRQKMNSMLNQLLADCSDLYSHSKQAHWNVKGPQFIALHLLFDQVAGAVAPFIDELAERAVALGGEANGTVRAAAANSKLPEYKLGAADGMQHVEALSSSLAAFGKSTRAAIDAAEDAGDMVTSDLCIKITDVIDHYTWFVEAHQQNAAAKTSGVSASASSGRTAAPVHAK